MKRRKVGLIANNHFTHNSRIESGGDDLQIRLSRAAQSFGDRRSALCCPDLLLRVLFNLPLPDLMRLRVTCKGFHQLLTSQHFWGALPADSYSRLSCSWMLVVRPYDVYEKEHDYMPNLHDFYIYWRKPSNHSSGDHKSGICGEEISTGKLIPLSTLVPRLATLIGDLRSMIVPYGSLGEYFDELMIASSGGLLCFLLYPQDQFQILEDRDEAGLENTQFQLLILNPMTGASKLLPPAPPTPPSWDCICSEIEMQTDETTSPPSYSVMLIFDDSEYQRTKIFDSRTGMWSYNEFVVKPTLSLRKIQTAHILFHFSGFDVGSSVNWDLNDHVPEPPGPDNIDCLHTAGVDFGYKGRIFYASTLYAEELICDCSECSLGNQCCVCMDVGEEPCRNFLNQGFGVWELVQAKECGVLEWVEVARTPKRYWPKFHSPVYHNMIAGQGLICATYTNFYRGQLNFAGEPHRPLVYDLEADSWYYLPKYTHNQLPNGHGIPVRCLRSSFVNV